jgi:hypothetical protein
MMEGAFSGKEILTTEDGSGNATATVYEIVRYNLEDCNGRGIAIAFIHSDSTGRLAPLNSLYLQVLMNSMQTKPACLSYGNGRVGYHYHLLPWKNLI